MIIWDVAGDRRLGPPFRTGFVRETSESFPPPFAISPDGRTLAVARLDGRVDLIDAETLRRTGGFEAFDGRPVLAIEYAPDGARSRSPESVAASASGTRRRKLASARSYALPAVPWRPQVPFLHRTALQPAQRPGARLRPWRSARRGGGWGHRADLGRRPARARRPAAAPASRRDRAGLQPRRLAARDPVRRDPLGRRRHRGSRRGKRPAARQATRRRRDPYGRLLPRWEPARRRSGEPHTGVRRWTARRSSGRPMAGGGSGRRWLCATLPPSRSPSPRTAKRWPPHTPTEPSSSGTSPRSGRSARRFRARPTCAATRQAHLLRPSLHDGTIHP